MSGKVRRCLALMMVALLAFQIMAWAEPEGGAAGLDAPVPELGVLELCGPEEEEISAPVEAEDARVSGYVDMEIGETLRVATDTWSGVNLRRAKGFTGMLAAVEGSLRLDDVCIEDTPAGELTLTDWFELSPGATVSCTPDAGLCLSVSAAALNKGEKLTLSPFSGGLAVKPKSVKWGTSDKKVASVTSRGEVKGQKKGAAVITATYDGRTAACGVVVTEVVLPGKIKFKKSSVTLGLDGMQQLEYTISPSDAEPVALTWTSSKPNVADVDGEGYVTALSGGETKITVTTSNGKKATCTVKVKGAKSEEVKPTGVRFTAARVEMEVGEVYPSAVNVSPSNAANRAVNYASSDERVATVDAAGRVTAVGKGTATITATCAANAGAKATLKITVTGESGGDVPADEVLPTGISFTAKKVIMEAGEAYPSEVKLTPSNASRSAVNYTSSNESVASVDAEGVVYALGEGTATITAACGAVQATLKITVSGQQQGPDPEPTEYGPGSGRLDGLIIGINPGHQHQTIKEKYPIAPGSSKKAKGVKTGASGKSTHQNEYEVVLDIGLKLKRILEEHGATVVITRTSNEVMLTNIDRALMLNEAGCDVALQLHNNSCSNSSKSGVSGYIRTTGEWVEESRAIAECLCWGMSANTPFENLGVKIENEFMSLNWTTTPSVLLEMGYLSNRSDDKLLAMDEIREGLAWGIYEGLCKYYKR